MIVCRDVVAMFWILNGDAAMALDIAHIEDFRVLNNNKNCRRRRSEDHASSHTSIGPRFRTSNHSAMASFGTSPVHGGSLNCWALPIHCGSFLVAKTAKHSTGSQAMGHVCEMSFLRTSVFGSMSG